MDIQGHSWIRGKFEANLKSMRSSLKNPGKKQVVDKSRSRATARQF